MKKTTVFILCIVLCFACQNKTRISYRGYGANETVGGSMHQLTIGEKNILVDCGIFYGDEGENYPLPEDLNIESIDAVLITHAHADHIGRIPLLLQNGYKGKIYTTEVSKDILIVSILSNLKYTDFGIESFYYSKNNTNSKKPVYLDRFSYGQYEVKPYNRVYIKAKRNDLDKMGFYLHKQTVKYLQQEIKQKLLQQLEAVDYGTSINMGDDIKATFYPTSHLPGAAMIYISALGKNILFTGDVGSDNSPFLRKNEKFILPVDFFFVEGTYATKPYENISDSLRRDFITKISVALAANKRIIIPAFAVDRTQQVLYEIGRGMNDLGMIGKSTSVKVFSPTAEEITNLYSRYSTNRGKYSSYFSDMMFGDIFNIQNLSINPREENGKMYDLNILPGEIAIMTTGMITGGFSKRAVEEFVSDSNSVFISVSYQDEDEIGGQLFDNPGRKSIDVDDKTVPVNAQILKSDAFSGHARISQMFTIFESISPEKIFIVHCNRKDVKDLQQAWAERYTHSQVIVPKLMDRERLY